MPGGRAGGDAGARQTRVCNDDREGMGRCGFDGLGDWVSCGVGAAGDSAVRGGGVSNADEWHGSDPARGASGGVLSGVQGNAAGGCAGGADSEVCAVDGAVRRLRGTDAVSAGTGNWGDGARGSNPGDEISATGALGC